MVLRVHESAFDQSLKLHIPKITVESLWNWNQLQSQINYGLDDFRGVLQCGLVPFSNRNGMRKWGDNRHHDLFISINSSSH